MGVGASGVRVARCARRVGRAGFRDDALPPLFSLCPGTCCRSDRWDLKLGALCRTPATYRAGGPRSAPGGGGIVRSTVLRWREGPACGEGRLCGGGRRGLHGLGLRPQVGATPRTSAVRRHLQEGTGAWPTGDHNGRSPPRPRGNALLCLLRLQVRQVFEASTFKLSLFCLYLGLKH